MADDDELLFGENYVEPDYPKAEPSTDTWKILIVDDEPQIHLITKLSLVNFKFANKELEFLQAYSAEEAKPLMAANSDIALVLLDVVMETDHAGLDLVRYIREQMNNSMLRIILRTGQPGVAPERDVITDYDINDYTEKTDLSAQKLFTVVVASLRAYRDIVKLEDSRSELIIANQTLDKERQRIQITLDSIGDAVFTTDANGDITHLNPVAEKLTGWGLNDAIGHPVTEIFKIVNAYNREVVANPVENVLQSGNIVELANHTVLISKEGTEYQIADSAAPIRDDEGKVIGVILVCRDVTKAYEAEDALRRTQKMEAIGQLSGGIAHDFNNQLGIVIGYLDILDENFRTEDDAKGWVATATKATLRCMDLTRQLLAFSRRQSKQKIVVNVNDTLKDMKTMLSRSITPEVELEYCFDEQLWLTEIDVAEFQDAILNLAINARDAMILGGKLIIETSNKCLDQDYVALNPEGAIGDYLQIIVSDTGKGMDHKTQERVFEPFYTTKPSGKGTGLGMSMVYGFVKRFDGFIKIYSEIDVGTTIRIYLPRSTSDKLTIKKESTDQLLPTGTGNILVVDDELELQTLASKWLNELGYQTYLAANAHEALDVLEKHKDIDLVFSDVVMPGGMNGYELAERVGKSFSSVKVVLTSGFSSKTMVQKGQEKYSLDLLSKPYRKIELAKTIQTKLDEK